MRTYVLSTLSYLGLKYIKVSVIFHAAHIHLCILIESDSL